MPTLLDPLKVGSLKLRNRIVMPPMATGFSTQKGEVTDRLVKHYSNRSQDLGLLIVEHAFVAPEGRCSDNQLGAYSDKLISGLMKLVESTHAQDTPIALQINHAGSATTSEICGFQPSAPSAIIHPTRGEELPRAMDGEDIERVIEAFIAAAHRAAEAGFDAVEVHGAHGFLLGQFVSPLTNMREDEFGGSLENRMRLPLMILERIRRELESGFTLLYRLGADDMQPNGLTIHEAVEAAKMIASKGVNILDVSGGLIGSRPPGLDGPGFFVPHAASVKKASGIPVIGVGGIKTAEEANTIIKSGKVDLVAIGRAILAEPEWASKAVKIIAKNAHSIAR